MSADKTISDDSSGRARFVLGANRETASHDGTALAGGVIGRRIAAFLIDLFIMGILWIVGWMLIIGSLGLLLPLVMLFFAAMPVIYSTILIASEGSATLGMRALGLRVINMAENGRPARPAPGFYPVGAVLPVALRHQWAAAGLVPVRRPPALPARYSEQYGNSPGSGRRFIGFGSFHHRHIAWFRYPDR